jgi:hypothetical protein
MKITLTLLNGSKLVHSSELSSVLIGRSEAAQFRIPDPGLSRQHALIENESGSFFVTDLGSSNGVFIDGQRIAASTKTSFSSFQTLSLGPLECLVSESDSVAKKTDFTPTTAQTRAPLKDGNEQTRTRVLVGKKDTRGALRKSEKNQSSPALVILVIVCFAGLVYYKMSGNKSEEPTEELTTTESKIKPVAVVPEVLPVAQANDEFLSQDAYAERYNKRSCLEFSDLCHELALDEKDLEGVLEREGEYFIYMKSSKRFIQVFSALETDPTKADIISLYTIIKSKLYQQLASGKVSQIHLVLFNDENKLYRAYRFKNSHLGKSQMELLKEIGSALTSKNSEAFWIKAKEKIPAMDFTL